MSDLPILLGLAALVLAFASLLLYYRLASDGVGRTRILRILVELWGAFILITALFAVVSSVLGTTPTGNIGGELLYRLSRFREMSFGQQALVVVLSVLALLLFIHAIWSLNTAPSRRTRTHDSDKLL